MFHLLMKQWNGKKKRKLIENERVLEVPFYCLTQKIESLEFKMWNRRFTQRR